MDSRLSPTQPPLPKAAQVFMLWQTFLENVDPLTKLLHTPTVQHKMMQATSSVEDLPKSTAALLFPIFLSAVTSLTSTECQRLMQAPKSEMITRYHTAARRALIGANLLHSSELEVIQGFVLLLVSGNALAFKCICMLP